MAFGPSQEIEMAISLVLLLSDSMVNLDTDAQ